MKYLLHAMTLNKEECKHIMRPIVKFGLTKAGIRITLHTAVRYGHQSLVVIGIFDPLLIQGAGLIAFLIKHYWKPTLSRPLLRANLSPLHLEVATGGRILDH